MIVQVNQKVNKMLELEIKNLKDEVANLSTQLAELIIILSNDKVKNVKPQAPLKVKNVKPQAPLKVEAAPVLERENKPVVEKVEINRDDLHALCTTLMRKDRGLKDTIKETIGSFGGATNLINVAENDINNLHAALSKLL